MSGGYSPRKVHIEQGELRAGYRVVPAVYLPADHGLDIVIDLAGSVSSRTQLASLYVLALRAARSARTVHIVGGRLEARRGLAEVLGAALPPGTVTWDDPDCAQVGVPTTQHRVDGQPDLDPGAPR